MFNFKLYLENGFDGYGWIFPDGKFKNIGYGQTHYIVALNAVHRDIIERSKINFKIDGQKYWISFLELIHKDGNSFAQDLKQFGIEDMEIESALQDGPTSADDFVMIKWGWIKVKKKDVELYDYINRKDNLYKGMINLKLDSVFVFDIKPRRGFDITLDDLRSGSARLPESPTSKGHKDYFVMPKDQENYKFNN